MKGTTSTTTASLLSTNTTTNPPAPIQLTTNAYNGESNYTISIVNYYGQNFTQCQLYENSILVGTKTTIDNTPNSQTVGFSFTGKTNGLYMYTATASNSAGSVNSLALSQKVSQGSVNLSGALLAVAVPAVPVLSPNNYDGNATYSIIANLWWGNNATTATWYENGILIASQTLTDNTPNPQQTSISSTNKPLGSYSYVVHFTNYFGTTSSLPLVYVVTKLSPNAPPPDPTSIIALASSTTSITITWLPGLLNFGSSVVYDILLDNSTLIQGITSSPYLAASLVPGSTHTVAMRSRNTITNLTSSWVPTVPLIVALPLPPLPPTNPPTGLQVLAVDSTTISLGWQPSATSSVTYDLQMDGQLLISNITTTNYVVTGLQPSSTHTFAVRVTNSSGSSPWSVPPISASTLSPPPPQLPAVPLALTAVATASTAINVSWEAAANATSYNLMINNNSATMVNNITLTNYLHANLQPNTTYVYQVQSVNSVGSSGWSSPISATTLSPPAPVSSGGNLSLGQASNVSNGRLCIGYYGVWRWQAFNLFNSDGSKISDNQIYNYSQTVMGTSGVITNIHLAFAQPNFSWSGIAANTWSGTGISLSFSPAILKECIRVMHQLQRKVILSVGGATYTNWSALALEAGSITGTITNMLAQIIIDLNLDGLDCDYEVLDASTATVNQYANVLLAMKTAIDIAQQSSSAQPSLLLSAALWSTGADYTADLSGDSGYLGTPSYWGGAAGRERKLFKMIVPSNYQNTNLIGKSMGSLLSYAGIMSYDAGVAHYDPIVAYNQYRSLLSCPLSIGFEVPPESWGGGVLTINNNQASTNIPGTMVLLDQYSKTVNQPYTVDRSIGYILNNNNNNNVLDGGMVWELSLTTTSSSVTGAATSVTIVNELAKLLNYVPIAPNSTTTTSTTTTTSLKLKK